MVPALAAKTRIIDVWGGRGRGGSHFGTDYFRWLQSFNGYFRGYFIRQTFGDIRDSLWRDFKDRVEDDETTGEDEYSFDESRMKCVHLPTGNMILSKGAHKDGSRTAKMKSLAGATHVLIEEADEMAEADFDQLDLSLRTTKADIQIIRVFNPPPKRHWIWRDYHLEESDVPGYFRARPLEGSGITSIHATYLDNLQNINESTRDKFERFLQTNPDYYYTVIRGLIGEGAKGRIYAGCNWQTITDKQFEEIDARTFYVVDFGYSEDPTAVAAFKFKDLNVYGRELLYEPGLDDLALAKRLIDLGITKKNLLLGDYGSGGDVRMANLRRGYKGIEGYPTLADGFWVYPVKKIDIRASISLVKSRVVHWTESSRNAWREYGEYKWAMDRDKNPTDEPVDKDNHLMDVLRYFVISIPSLRN